MDGKKFHYLRFQGQAAQLKCKQRRRDKKYQLNVVNGKVSSKISYGAINLLSNKNKVPAESGAYLSIEQNLF